MAHTLFRRSLILLVLIVTAACNGSSSSGSADSESGGTGGSSASAMGGRSGSSHTAGGGSGAPAGTGGTVTSNAGGGTGGGVTSGGGTGGSVTSGGGTGGSVTSGASAGVGSAAAGGDGETFAGAGGAAASGAPSTGGSLQTGGAAQSGGTAGEPANTGGGPTGPLVTLVGIYTTIANPCTTDPCLPGVVAAIETASDTIILLVDGHWIMENCDHFNGFRRGEALQLVGYYATIGIEVVSMTHIIEGSAGAGGSSATGGAGGSAPDPGTGGPPMVRLPEGFFIDSTEVTRSQYEAWLATNPATSTQIEECETNTTFAPECGDTSPCQGDDCDRPQVCVDWCDAYQYCQAVGKRLCGSLGQDATQSEWVTACSAHAKNFWVYGNDYDPQVCSVPELRLDAPTPVGSMNGCQSTEPGYEGVYDLIGNVYEWQNSCSSSSCDLRGGSYDLIGRDDLQDRCTDSISKLRSVNSTDIGFRCCASP